MARRTPVTSRKSQMGIAISISSEAAMLWNLVSGIVVTVAEISKRYPRAGGPLLALPLVSVLAILATWFQQRDLSAISRLSRETLILVPLGLPFLVPFSLRSSTRSRLLAGIRAWNRPCLPFDLCLVCPKSVRLMSPPYASTCCDFKEFANLQSRAIALPACL
jgi:hypothetical protein